MLSSINVLVWACWAVLWLMGDSKSRLSPLNKTNSCYFLNFSVWFFQSKSGARGVSEINFYLVCKDLQWGVGNNYRKSSELLSRFIFLPSQCFYFEKSSKYMFSLMLWIIHIYHQILVKFCLLFLMRNRIRSTDHVFTQQFCVSLVLNNFPIMSELFLIRFFLSREVPESDFTPVQLRF